jgi:hypothetical protein
MNILRLVNQDTSLTKFYSLVQKVWLLVILLVILKFYSENYVIHDFNKNEF